MAAQEPASIGLTWLLDRAAREPDAAERLAPGRDAWSDAFVDESRCCTATGASSTHPHASNPGRFLEQPAPDAFMPFGLGARRCLGQALAELQIQTIVPTVLRRLRLTPVSRRPERQIVRATVLPPPRSALVVASRR